MAVLPYICIDGIVKAIGKKIAMYAFRDEMLFFRPNYDDKLFEIWVSDAVSQEHINDFLTFWNKKHESWKITVVPSGSEIQQEREYDDD